jgi:predicted ester cyclase
MDLSGNKAVVRGFIEDVLNRRNLAALSQYVGEGAVDHFNGASSLYLALAAFPDFHINIELMIGNDDHVGVLTNFTGSHQAPFMDQAPTGKGISSRAAFSFRIRGGKIVESWSEFEPWGLLPQLGINPLMHAPRPTFSDH